MPAHSRARCGAMPAARAVSRLKCRSVSMDVAVSASMYASNGFMPATLSSQRRGTTPSTQTCGQPAPPPQRYPQNQAIWCNASPRASILNRSLNGLHRPSSSFTVDRRSLPQGSRRYPPPGIGPRRRNVAHHHVCLVLLHGAFLLLRRQAKLTSRSRMLRAD